MGEFSMANNTTIGTISSGTALPGVFCTGEYETIASKTCYAPSIATTIGTVITGNLKAFENDTTFKFSFNNNWNTKPKKMFNEWTSSFNPSIVNINIIVPNKVVEVTIYDGTEHVYKQVCKEPDVFDLKFALALAWAKYENEKGAFGSKLNIEGLERAAKRFLKYSLDYNKEFDRAIKAYNRFIEKRNKEEAEEKERLAIIERRKAKNKKRKEKALAKKKQEEIDVIIKAIKESRG